MKLAFPAAAWKSSVTVCIFLLLSFGMAFCRNGGGFTS
jgi:hypothetical protein